MRPWVTGHSDPPVGPESVEGLRAGSRSLRAGSSQCRTLQGPQRGVLARAPPSGCPQAVRAWGGGTQPLGAPRGEELAALQRVPGLRVQAQVTLRGTGFQVGTRGTGRNRRSWECGAGFEVTGKNEVGAR